MEWNIIVGAFCAIVGMALSYIAFSRNKSKDDQAAGQQIGVILTELGNTPVRLNSCGMRTVICRVKSAMSWKTAASETAGFATLRGFQRWRNSTAERWCS